MTTGCSTSVQRCILVVLGLAFLQEAYSSDMYQDILQDKDPLNLIKNRQKRQDHSGHVTECNVPSPVCDFGAKYRTFDGSCNNIDNPSYGMANRIQKRLVPNAYDDGRYMPRNKGCGGKELPNVRHLSNIIHASWGTTELDKKRSLFIMTFGQFLAHDMDLTPKFQNEEGIDLPCCGIEDNKDKCMNIAIPEGDQRFETDGCMSFTRSIGRVDCDGVRQQVNMHSSYLDLSVAYGKSEAEALSLRTLSGGLLTSVANALPVDTTNATCRLDEPDPPRIFCPKSGDPRTNETPVLASLHTILHREHNRLARALAEVNPSWDDEKLFQEARKINIGQWQHIVYNEYLPATIGSIVMVGYGLGDMPFGTLETYNSSVDATVFNAFSTAAFRFGHSLIPDVFALTKTDFSPKRSPVEMKNHFFNTELYHLYDKMGLEHLLLGAASSPCPRMDRKFEDSVRNNLFLDDNGHAFDLVALNTQRGRDHGLPGYNEYREFCGLPRATHFHTTTGGLVDHSPKVAALLKEAYSCTDDIDLFTGMVTEKVETYPGTSIVGPTVKCLLAKQFKNLMYGDRFFYMRPDPEIAFTVDQLEEIRKVRMSTLFCLNSGTEYIQENMFLRAKRADGQRGSCFRDSFSDLVPCYGMPRVNITMWKEG